MNGMAAAARVWGIATWLARAKRREKSRRVEETKGGGNSRINKRRQWAGLLSCWAWSRSSWAASRGPGEVGPTRQ